MPISYSDSEIGKSDVTCSDILRFKLETIIHFFIFISFEVIQVRICNFQKGRIFSTFLGSRSIISQGPLFRIQLLFQK